MRLRTFVHVPNESGQMIEWGPEDGDLPDDVAAKITNPSVWAGAEDTEPDDVFSIPVPTLGDPEVETVPGEGGDGSPADEPEAEDVLMALHKKDLQEIALEVEAEGLDSKATKAEIVAAIRAAGYEGDGSEVE